MKDGFDWTRCRAVVANRLERSFGWDRENSALVAEIVADAMRREFGGKRHYLPGKNGVFADRIRAEFDGRNIAELSRLYGVSCMTVRRYLRKK